MSILSTTNKTVLGILCVIIFTAGYAQGVTVRVVPPDGMKRGNSYTVPIQVSNFNNVNAFQFEFQFNKNNLQLSTTPSVSYLGISIASTNLEVANANGKLIVLWVSAVSILNFGNGELLDLNITVLSNANVGVDTIKFTECIVADINGTSLNPQYYDSTINILTGVKENSSPNAFSLYQNYPNPFNPSTIIRYRLQMESFVKLNIFDMLGNEVAMLVNEKQQAGDYTVPFSTLNGSLSSGVYFYKIDAGIFHQIRKMILLK
ncbi:MAG: T9SS type A sorting domain-containing protein [Ignavibacteriales bacterium]|nr:T9SS type A sorting domain-containing protein [Ignavibacteriales bacterium]